MESLSSSGESLLHNEYKLALKHFINKDFHKSFDIVSKVYAVAIRNYVNNQLREKTFIKIVSLYLTEVGILLPAHSSVIAHDKKNIVESLRNDELLRKLHGLYGNTASIPYELLYQIFLVYYTCQGVLGEPIVEKFKITYHNLSSEIGDLESIEDDYFQRWFQLFLFNVLPDSDDFETANAILEKRFPNNHSAKDKLVQIQNRKADEARMARENKTKAKKAEAEMLAKKKEKEHQEVQEKNLKYMSMKQIRQNHNNEKEAPQEKKTAALMHRVKYFYELAKRSVGQNSPTILLVLVCLFVGGKFLRSRRYNLREKFKETMSMAFKVTYL